MFVIVWEFRVKHDRLAEFKKAYEPNGDWSRLFARGQGFVGTQLLRDRDDRNRFLTVDTWQSREAFEAFRAQFEADYLALDARTEAFTEAEERVGAFDPVDASK